jgi:glycosyltransferase involved in cell wall biosynthesis
VKIALCKSSFAGPVSGADETVVSYALQLHQAGHEVKVVLLYAPAQNDQYLRQLEIAGVPVIVIVARSYLFSFLRALRKVLSGILFLLFLPKHAPQRLRKIWRVALKLICKIWRVALRLISRLHYRECRAYFAGERPDLLHVFTPDTGTALMIRAGHELSIPILYHEMGTPHHLPTLEDYYRHLETVLPLCTEFAALSPRLASEWQVRFPFLPQISVLPLITERHTILNLGPQSQAEARRVAFGFAARLEKGKGPLRFVEAMAEVNRDGRLGIARIAGIGPQLLQVKARVRDLELGDACEFVGHYSEPWGRAAFMNSLDVFVLPSLAEGTPNSIIEAMAHGVPVIASEVGGISDMIGEDAGIRVPPGDTGALAEAMLRLAKDPELRRQMGTAAAERYQKLFSPKVVLPLMLDIYQRVARNGHSAKAIAAGNGSLHPWAKSLNGNGVKPGC